MSGSVFDELRPPGGWYTTADAAPEPGSSPPKAARRPGPPVPRVRLERLPVPSPSRERPPASEWLERAACAGVDPALFFPGRGEETKSARAICAGCPVREDCLEYALRTGEKFGIWGGKSERERRRLRRARLRGAA